MTLECLEPKTSAVVKKIACDRAEQAYLHALGITPLATIVKLHDTSANGPVLISTQHHCNLAIGRDIAQNIIVEVKR